MTERERNKILMRLLNKLITDEDIESIRLLENLVDNDTPAMKKSFEIMTKLTNTESFPSEWKHPTLSVLVEHLREKNKISSTGDSYAINRLIDFYDSVCASQFTQPEEQIAAIKKIGLQARKTKQTALKFLTNAGIIKK